MQQLSRWSIPFAVVVLGAALLEALDTGIMVTLLGAGVVLVAGWAVSPLRRAGVSHAEAVAGASAGASGRGAVVVYWRHGCTYCMRLWLLLGRSRRAAAWVDIWADEEAAAFVRSVNDGNETVPTVVLPSGETWTNPPPARVRELLRR